ncbi:MAG: DUF3147 family protein [Deltaproteobacteria bacterium]|nr:MAG: DUF3147 family protein [Deltaproteobacteria bacterium]
MHLAVKIALSLAVILTATAVGRKWPALAGLVGVMPLTGALVLTWVALDSGSDPQVMQQFTRGALWGLVPTVLFFLVALLCFRRGLSLPAVLAASFGAWLGAALLHQWALK